VALHWLESTASEPLGLVVETSGIDLSSEWNPTGQFRFQGKDRIDRVVPRELMHDFVARNHESTSLPGLGTVKSFHRIHQEALENIFAEGQEAGWQKLRKDFGVFEIVTLSLPGYASDDQSTLLCLFINRGTLAGDGYFLYLKRVQGTWCIGWIDIIVSS
jgi:hypothetical protein